MYVFLRKIYLKRKIFRKVNWIKTIYFNCKMFPFATAKKLPVLLYGRVKLQDISGQIEIQASLETGMIGFGQPYELNSVHKGTAEIVLQGKMVFKGHVQFGKDYFIYVAKEAYAEFGHMSSLASSGKIICTDRIILGDYARIGSESQIIDTNFHQMTDTVTGEKFPISASVVVGNYNYISNRVSLMQNTCTPDYCTIASNTLCNKDYTSLGENILIGGIPAKLLKTNITRDWVAEKALLDQWLKIW
jgi:acetyltransferase-like isoleucine patch superfamily enzyme